MPDKERQEKLLRFEQYNFEGVASGNTPRFHDNDIRSIRIVPAQESGEPSFVEFLFYDRGARLERTLKLKQCVNLRFAIDFDILSGNASSATNSAGQTSNVEIKDCNDCIERLLKQGVADWNVEYPPRKDTPASYKSFQLHKFILVKVTLHGGTLEIVARDFEISDKSI